MSSHDTNISGIAHRTLRNVDYLADSAKKPTEKPTDKCSVRFRFGFGFGKKQKKRPKPTDFSVKKRKTDRGHFHFRFTTLPVRPIMQHFFRFKKTLFALSVCDFIFELPCTSVESYARVHVKTSVSPFSYYTETTRTTYDTRYRYQVQGIYSKQQFATGTPIVLLYIKGDPVRIEPRPPSPNTCRLCAHSSRTLCRPQASGDSTRMQGVFGESRASCLLSVVNNSRA